MTRPSRIAVLASGRGSNLQCLLDAISAGQLDAGIVGVFSDKPAAAALEKVPGELRWARSPRDYADRDAFDLALGDAVAASQPDWIVCAGYMRILGASFVQRFKGQLVNIATRACTPTPAPWKPASSSMVPACISSCPSSMPAT
jgi:phosphoribosylglycinamide formyltransferase-1